MIMNYIDKFSGNGTQAVFHLTGIPVEPKNIQAIFDGCPKIYGQDFCIKSNSIIFIEKPNTGVDNVIVLYVGDPLP